MKYSQAHATIGGRKHYYKSRWERNYARYLQWLKDHGEIVDWAYEKKTFWFEGIKRGTTNYKPDFEVAYVKDKNDLLPDYRFEYHEVKGWMDPKSKTKLKRMAKYHPDTIVKVIDRSWFKRNQNLRLIIKDWE